MAKHQRLSVIHGEVVDQEFVDLGRDVKDAFDKLFTESRGAASQDILSSFGLGTPGVSRAQAVKNLASAAGVSQRQAQRIVTSASEQRGLSEKVRNRLSGILPTPGTVTRHVFGQQLKNRGLVLDASGDWIDPSGGVWGFDKRVNVGRDSGAYLDRLVDAWASGNTEHIGRTFDRAFLQGYDRDAGHAWNNRGDGPLSDFNILSLSSLDISLA